MTGSNLGCFIYLFVLQNKIRSFTFVAVDSMHVASVSIASPKHHGGPQQTLRGLPGCIYSPNPSRPVLSSGGVSHVKTWRV